jgi:hypothetical protein
MARPDPDELERFKTSFLYREEGFLLDEVLDLDAQEHSVRARLDTTKPLPYTRLQRNGPHHPAHVAAAEMLALTGSLGCLHAWFFHGCRWDEGWTGFGNRIHRADFRTLARLGPPLDLHSRETRARTGPRRVVIRYAFRFEQQGRPVYLGDQTAMFLKEPDFSQATPQEGSDDG